MTLQTKKRKYEKPAMQVFELKQTPQLLQMSDRGPYTPDDDNPFGG